MFWQWNSSFGIFHNTAGWWLFLLVWSVLWKGIALWTAAKRSDKVWFIVFMVIQSGGLLELFYLLFVSNSLPTKTVTDKTAKKKMP